MPDDEGGGMSDLSPMFFCADRGLFLAFKAARRISHVDARQIELSLRHLNPVVFTFDFRKLSFA